MMHKESVFDWFKHAASYKRIDLLCGLVQMCHPLERRFIASYIEDLCRLAFSHFRSEELKSNAKTELEKLECCLFKEHHLSKYILAISLLSSSNYVCANTLAQQLSAALQHFLSQADFCSNGNLLQFKKTYEDVLLLLTMASNHPAFSYEKKAEFSEHYMQIAEGLRSKLGCQNQDEVFSHELVSGADDEIAAHGHDTDRSVFLSSMELLTDKSQKSMPADKKSKYVIKVIWCDNKEAMIEKTYHDFHHFHNTLIKAFPNDSGAHKQDRLIPYLPQESSHTAEELTDLMAEYVIKLSKLPAYILHSHHLTKFFYATSNEDSKLIGGLVSAENVSNNARVIEYDSTAADLSSSASGSMELSSARHVNGQLDEKQCSNVSRSISQTSVHNYTSKARHKNENYGSRIGSNMLATDQARSIHQNSLSNVTTDGQSARKITGTATMRLATPTSPRRASPTSPQRAAPTNNHAYSVNTWIKQNRLSTYSEQLSKYTPKQLVELTDSDLDQIGLKRGAKTRFKAGIENLRSGVHNDENKSDVKFLETINDVTPPTCMSPVTPSSVEDCLTYSEDTSPPDSPQLSTSGNMQPELSDSSSGGKVSGLKAQKVQAVENKATRGSHRVATHATTRNGSLAVVQCSPAVDQQGSALVRPKAVSPSYNPMYMPRMLQPPLRTPRPILGARHDNIPARAMPVPTPRLRNGYHLPANHPVVAPPPVSDPAGANGKHNSSALYQSSYPVTSNASRPNALDVQQPTQNPLQIAVSKNMSSYVMTDRPPPPLTSTTPGLLSIQALNAQGDPAAAAARDAAASAGAAGVYQSVTTSTVTYAVTQQYQVSSSSSPSPVLSTAYGNSSPHSSVPSPAPGSYSTQAPSTVPSPGPVLPPPSGTLPTPDAGGGGSEFTPVHQANLSSQMALTPSTPLHYSYCTQPQAWPVPSSPQHVYSAHPGFMPQQPAWNTGTNGLINPQPPFATLQYSVPPAQNGYAHDLTFQHQPNQIVHNILNPATGAMLSLPYPHAYTYPGPYNKARSRPQISCYNCGTLGHKAIDCTETTMGDIVSSYSMNLEPKNAPPPPAPLSAE